MKVEFDVYDFGEAIAKTATGAIFLVFCAIPVFLLVYMGTGALAVYCVVGAFACLSCLVGG